MTQTIRTKKLKEGEIVPITFDYVFTNIFNNPDNMIILENFLACYLNVDVNKIRGKVEIINRNLIIEHKKEANKQIDLLVDIEGEKINIVNVNTKMYKKGNLMMYKKRNEFCTLSFNQNLDFLTL